ncbi:MAG: hypothetical protein HND52_01370 [Ignavibacteriae bacterium]|nr:hypothetical protein [Ignavibacteriota bacterium]NOG96599.1 hypothetical protein [Ignavibacteriota bacterium]
MIKKFTTYLILAAIIFLFSCTDKFDPNLDVMPTGGTGNIGDTVYVQLSPDWTGFNEPKDMIIGKDNFLYIADTENDRVVMMDISGAVIGSINIKKPVAIEQDYRLNLIVCGKYDYTKDGITTTFGAVYKLNLFEVDHDITAAVPKLILPDTTKLSDLSRPSRQYTGVCVFADNSYYIGRTGPSNSSAISPDNAIMHYQVLKDSIGNRYDSFKEILPRFEPLGTGIRSTNEISSLTSFNFPTRDFIVTLETNSFKSQWLQFVRTADFEGYETRIEVGREFMLPNKFGKPEDAAVDNANNIYIADSQKDSVFIFNSFGDELQSFGGSELFDSPHAVAFFDKTLYVLDTKNDRIVRFILSTEIE